MQLISLKPAIHIIITWAIFSTISIYPAISQASDYIEEAEIRVLLIPEIESEISSRIDAEITKIHGRDGDQFHKGENLVEFDCELINAHLQKARYDFEAAQETHDANLQLQGFGSASQLDVAISSARVKRAQAEVLVNTTIVKKCIIKAPFSGKIVKLEATPFESVSQGDPIMEIIDTENLLIRLLIPSKWLRWLKTGASFTVHIDETLQKYSANISGMGAKINPINQTIEVFGKFTKLSPALLPGMSGTAFFPPPKQ
jgi:membrane fusion protein (multidrug efflux system)